MTDAVNVVESHTPGLRARQGILWQEVVRLRTRGVPVALVRIEWDTAKNKKRMAVQPHRGWHLQPSPTDDEITRLINAGCNAYLYRLPDDVWVVDADTQASVAWMRQHLGPAPVRTPRGEHRLYRWHERGTVPAGLPETHSDMAVRQLYGPGSFYDTPDGTVTYSGVVPDFRTLADMPVVLRGTPGVAWPSGSSADAAVITPPAPTGVPPQDAAPGGARAVPLSSPPSAPALPAAAPPPAASAIDAHFTPGATAPPITRSQALARANALAHAIRTGPRWGDAARQQINSAAFFLGGLLHAGWWTEQHARELLAGACAYRWGAADDDDLRWIEEGMADGARPAHRLRYREDDVRYGPFDPGAAGEGGDRGTVGDRLLTVDELDELPDPEPWLDGLIDRGTFALIYGAGGDGKSFVALDIVCAAASGRDWHGRAVAPSTVLYVVGEGQSGVKKRIRAWREQHGVAPADMRLYIHPGAVDLYGQIGPTEVTELIETCRGRGVDTVVFDTWNQCTPGLEENSAKDTQLTLLNIKRIQAAGMTVIVIHHTPRDGVKPRGSTALEFATDAALYIKKSGSTIVVESARQKDAESGEKRAFTLVAQVLGTSAYLVPAVGPVDTDLTHGAAFVPPTESYDATVRLPTGVEEYRGKGAKLVPDLAQMLAQHGTANSRGFTLAEATKRLGRRPSDSTTFDAWNVLWAAGALTGKSGASRCWWVPPGPERDTELTRRLCT